MLKPLHLPRYLHSLRFKLNMFILLILVAMVLFAFGFMQHQRKQMIQEIISDTRILSNVFKRTAVHHMSTGKVEELREIIASFGEDQGIDKVRLMDGDGKIVMSTDEDEIGLSMEKEKPACLPCHESEVPKTKLEIEESARIVETGSQPKRRLAILEPIHAEAGCGTSTCHAHPADRKILGFVDMRVSLDDVDSLVVKTRRTILIVTIICMTLLALVLWLFHLRFIDRPVTQLLTAMERAAGGNLDQRIPVESKDELGLLAKSFNKMLDDLKKAEGDLQNWAKTLEEKVQQKAEELRAVQNQVLRTEKLVSLGKLAAGVAHEINSPLTGILTFSHLLRKRLEKEGDEEDADVIINEATRCSKIVKGLLDFAREAPPEKIPVDINKILQRTIAIVENQADFHNIEIVRELDGELPEIMADPNQLQQVFMNIILNGADAMSVGGGVLAVGTSTIKDNGEPEWIEIVFEDEGRGIPEDDLGRIFDPFFTTKEVGKGTGLGLSVTYGIVQKHHGTIEVHSEESKGTTFIIRLPVKEVDILSTA